MALLVHRISFFIRCISFLRYPGPNELADNYNEDCLTLNIARPANARNLPVTVWIHGGSFQSGTASSASLNLTWFVDASIAASKPLIVVSINYRLNYFGFLAGNEMSAEGNTNLGLHDQRRALHWVQENIVAFGGDPRKVTIFGQSAYRPPTSVLNLSGAKSVAAHMFAFNGRDDSLFRGAILQSGAPVTGIYWPATSNYSQTAYDLVVYRTGCLSASDQLSCLRSLDFTALFNAMKCTSDFTLPFYLPSIDGGIIAESPSMQIGKGRYVKVPTLQGQNNDEGALFTAWVQSNSDAETRGFFSSTQFVLLH